VEEHTAGGLVLSEDALVPPEEQPAVTPTTSTTANERLMDRSVPGEGAAGIPHIG
jgi:hypothetical protein